MAIETVKLTKNTRGANSREIVFDAIGKFEEKTVQKESKPVLNEDGTPKLDEEGEPIREPLGKDDKGNQITYPEVVNTFVSAGVVTDITELIAFAESIGLKEAEQAVIDWAVAGFNDFSYEKESGKDELDEFLKDMELNEEQAKQFRRTARAMSKTVECTILEAAELLSGSMKKNLKKAS